MRSGQQLRFKLRANATVTRAIKGDDGQIRRMRHDVVMDRKRALRAAAPAAELPPGGELWGQAGRAWLERRGTAHGFGICHCTVDGHRVFRFARQAGKAPVSLAALDFSGVLEVIDPERLRAALFGGIGHGKAYGLGLLLVKPL